MRHRRIILSLLPEPELCAVLFRYVKILRGKIEKRKEEKGKNEDLGGILATEISSKVRVDEKCIGGEKTSFVVYIL